MSTFLTIKESFRKDKNIILFLILCLLISCYLVTFYPIYMERPQYACYANLITSSWKWVNQIDYFNCFCGSDFCDITTYRMIGYPLLIVLFKNIFGASNYLPFLTGFQLIVWYTSGYILWNFLKQLGLKSYYRIFGLLVYLFGWGWQIQHGTYTDSLYASVFMLTLISCSRILLKETDTAKIKDYFKSGFFLVILLLLREVTAQILIIFIGLFLGPLLREKSLKSLLDQTKKSVCFFLPVIFTITCFSSWNYLRTGYYFFNLGARTALTAPLEHAIIENNKVLDNSLVYDEESKIDFLRQIKEKKLYKLKIEEFFLDSIDCNKLRYKYEKSEPEINELIKKEYYRLWKEFPYVMLKIMKEDALKLDLLFLLRPLESVEDYYTYYQEYWGEKKKLPHLSDIKNKPLSSLKVLDVVFVFLVNFCRLISLVPGGLFLIGFPLLTFYSLYRKSFGKIEQINLFLGCLYFGYIIAYAAVHIETRYLAAVFPIPAYIGLLYLQELESKFKKSKIFSGKRRD